MKRTPVPKAAPRRARAGNTKSTADEGCGCGPATSECCGPASAKSKLAPRGTARRAGRSRLQVFDPAMCCPTGVCGPRLDPALVQFAADLKWLEARGVGVERFNPAQTPSAFAENELVRKALAEKGEAALPLLLVDGRIVLSGRYPGRDQLAAWGGVAVSTECAEADSAEDDAKGCCCP